ncbi:MAG: hypothetical protein MJ078_01255 [Clostridia bacterium]|nr:hypothetical protein [Clostridia bacterium]
MIKSILGASVLISFAVMAAPLKEPFRKGVTTVLSILFLSMILSFSGEAENAFFPFIQETSDCPTDRTREETVKAAVEEGIAEALTQEGFFPPGSFSVRVSMEFTEEETFLRGVDILPGKQGSFGDMPGALRFLTKKLGTPCRALPFEEEIG